MYIKNMCFNLNKSGKQSLSLGFLGSSLEGTPFYPAKNIYLNNYSFFCKNFMVDPLQKSEK